MKTGLFIVLLFLITCGCKKDASHTTSPSVNYQINQITITSNYKINNTWINGKITSYSIDTGGTSPMVININTVNSYLMVTSAGITDTIGKLNSNGDLNEIYGYADYGTGGKAWDTMTIVYNVDRRIISTQSKTMYIPTSGPTVYHTYNMNYTIVGDLTTGYTFTTDDPLFTASSSGTLSYYDTIDNVGIFNVIDFNIGVGAYSEAHLNLANLNMAEFYNGYLGKQLPKLVNKVISKPSGYTVTQSFTYSMDNSGRATGYTELYNGGSPSSEYFSY